MKLFFYITFFFLCISFSKSIEIDTVWKTEQPFPISIAGANSDSSNILLRGNSGLISVNTETGQMLEETYTKFDYYYFRYAFVSNSIVYLVTKKNIIFKYNYAVGEILDSLRISENVFDGDVSIDLSPDESILYIAQDNYLSVVDLNNFELIAQDFVSGVYMVSATFEPNKVIIAWEDESFSKHRLQFAIIENDSTIIKENNIDANDDSYSDLDLLNNENAIFYCDGNGDIWKYFITSSKKELIYDTQNTIGLNLQLFHNDRYLLSSAGTIYDSKLKDFTKTGASNNFLIPYSEKIVFIYQIPPMRHLVLLELDFLSNIDNHISKELNTIFPNPTKDYINIDFSNQISFIGNQLSIYNIQGRVLYSQIISNEIERIDVSGFNAGKYFIKIENSNQKLIGSFIKE